MQKQSVSARPGSNNDDCHEEVATAAVYGSIKIHQQGLRNSDQSLMAANSLTHDLRQSQHFQSISTSKRLFNDSVQHALDNRSFVLRQDIASIQKIQGKATILSEVFNMTKNLVGSGVLSLSGGIAMYANMRMAVVSATFWILALGAVFGYFCLIIAKSCQVTCSATYRECWERSIGPGHGAWQVALVNALKPALGNLACSAILSQTLPDIMENIGWHVSRIQALWLVTILALLPLCLLQNLNILTPFSIMGIFSITLTAVAMMIRYLDGSYLPETGQYYKDLPANLQPNFGTRNEAWTSTQALPFICMVFEAWVMHYNSPRFYAELQNASIPRYTLVVLGAFSLSAVLYIAIAAAGFWTFGDHADNYILNNYSPFDPVATVCRILIAGSTIATYPVVFCGFRDGMIATLNIPIEKQTTTNLNLLTMILLFTVTTIAMFVTDLGLINAIGGGTLATILCFLLPALMLRQAAVLQLDEDSESDPLVEEGLTSGRCEGQHHDLAVDTLTIERNGPNTELISSCEVLTAMSLMTIGVTMGIVGVFVALQQK